MVEISVIVCTHNPRRDYFERCVAALRAQSVVHERWELILIDNASAPEKAPSSDLSWHPAARLFHEPKLGLTHARLRAIREAKGSVLVFVDDDNVLAPDYLQTVLRVSEEMPFLGSWSGQCRPEFEVPPPDWTRRYWGNLAIREFERDRWSNLPRLPESMPCGAGLCVRREVAARYLWLHDSGQRSFTFDRIGKALLSGGDNDLAGCACDLGLGVGVIAALRLIHLIPPERLAVDYLARLSEGIQFSGMLLDQICGIVSPRPSLGRRLLFWLRLPFLSREDAKIALAVERGKARARDLLRRGAA